MTSGDFMFDSTGIEVGFRSGKTYSKLLALSRKELPEITPILKTIRVCKSLLPSLVLFI